MEDCTATGLKFHGATSAGTFREVLVGTCKSDIVTGFGIELPEGDRGVPPEHELNHSIFTLQVEPRLVSIVTGYKAGTLKVQFTDSSGRFYTNFPITDLGFHNFAQKKHGAGDFDELNDWINGQEEVFLRIGLSGIYQPPNQKNAYWMQANGIYTFPEAPPGIRIHPK